MQGLNKHNLFKNSQIRSLTLSALTNRVYDKYNQCIDIVQVVLSAAHVRSFVFLPSIPYHQIFSTHHVTVNR